MLSAERLERIFGCPACINMSGRWVGRSYDGPIITRWGAIAKSQGEVLCLMNQLKEKGTVTAA